MNRAVEFMMTKDRTSVLSAEQVMQFLEEGYLLAAGLVPE
jgi:hypothetical protein